VGDVSGAEDPAKWQSIVERMKQGATAVFLSPGAFRKGKDPVGWLPLEKKGRIYRFNDWLYHKECVARRHAIFEGLGNCGIMDWDYFGQLISSYLFDGQDTPDDVAAAAFAVGYSIPGGFASGVLAGSYRMGAGRMVVNTFRVVEELDSNPTADRMLLNLINYAANLR
jgi:hypothetical protein